jgi:hypothetical protein
VIIGAREIYDQVVRIGAAVDKVADKVADSEQEIADHEARIRALERARWPLPALAVLVSIASLVLAYAGLIGK